MKTTACLLVIIVTLPVCLHAQSPEPKPDPAKAAPAKNTDTPAVPAEVMDLARTARDQFERGDYRAAEKTYDQALAKAPDNLYLLSNKGVVLLREQKYKLAEVTFKKAIAVAPNDDFSHCTLGIVYYTEGKLAEAIDELTKALAINPKNSDAHNYLGIVAGQTSQPNTARKELEDVITLEANFDGPAFRPPPWIGDILTPLEKSRFRIPSGQYEPLRPIRDPISH